MTFYHYNFITDSPSLVGNKFIEQWFDGMVTLEYILSDVRFLLLHSICEDIAPKFPFSKKYAKDPKTIATLSRYLISQSMILLDSLNSKSSLLNRKIIQPLRHGKIFFGISIGCLLQAQ